MAMLVEAPAAVEDALASLLDHTDPVVRRRALATYAKRLYHPFLLHEPELREFGDALLAGESAAGLLEGARNQIATAAWLCGPAMGGGGCPKLAGCATTAPATSARALTVPARLPALLASCLALPCSAVWAYDDVALAATPFSRECHGGALIVRSLHAMPAALAELEHVRSQTGACCCVFVAAVRQRTRTPFAMSICWPHMLDVEKFHSSATHKQPISAFPQFPACPAPALPLPLQACLG